MEYMIKMRGLHLGKGIGAMRWGRFLFYFLLTAMSIAKPFSEEEVAELIQEYSRRYGVKEEYLYTLASIESDFEPMAITVETSGTKAAILSNLRKAGVRVLYSPKSKTFHSKRNVVAIYPEDKETAMYIIRLLKAAHFTFDVGLMQINSVNFSLKEAPDILFPRYNVKKAAEVFNGCQKRFRRLVHQVECYNRGAGNLSKAIRRGSHYYPYWVRFRRHYRRYFNKEPR